MNKLLIVLGTLFLCANASAARCSDFVTQADAQRWHEEHGGNTRLDGDKDGEACECLPGGSAEGSEKCQYL